MKSIHLLFVLILICGFGVGCNKSAIPSASSASGAAASPSPGAGNATANNPASGPASENASNGSSAADSGAAPAPQPVVVPSGKVFTVRLSQALSSKGSQPGESFLGALAEPIVVNGQPVIERGATVRGTVVNAKAMGHFKGGALLQLKLNSVTIKGEEHSIQTRLWSQELKGKGKRSAIAIGGGAGLGAALGGAFGGGKGAAIGALAGGGAGTAGAAYTGNKEIELPAESALRFTLTRAVEVK